MKNKDFNKMLNIGPGGINCGCCVDFPKKQKNHKRLLRRFKRKIIKRFDYKQFRECSSVGRASA